MTKINSISNQNDVNKTQTIPKYMQPLRSALGHSNYQIVQEELIVVFKRECVKQPKQKRNYDTS